MRKQAGFTNTDDDKLRLCAPASKVAHEKLRRSSSANGATGR
jgi:hypothetical protein